MDCLIQTSYVDKNSTVEDALNLCILNNVPGLPFVNDENEIICRFSIRHFFKITSITPDMIHGAHLLGDAISHMDIPACCSTALMQTLVSKFLINETIQLTPDSQIVKAMALMERYNTSYLFVIDSNNKYLGTITRLSICKHMLQSASSGS